MTKEWCCSGKRELTAIARLILVAILLGSPLGTAGGFADSDARTFELQRDLRMLRQRVERAPRASRFDLRSLQRRVRAQRTENPRDPKLQELALELDQLRAKADRAARRSATATPRSTSAQLDTFGYFAVARPPAAPSPTRPYLGQRMVAMQRSAAEIARRLEHGDTAAAARLLEAVKADMATLRAVYSSIVAADPNMIALESEIRAFEHRLKGD
jgi:hypothetical protein